MKKFLGILLTCLCFFGLVACEDTTTEPQDTHTHTFATMYSCDEEYHWYQATCEHTDEVREKEEHEWNEGVVTKQPTAEAEGKKVFTCTVCGYEKEVVLDKEGTTHTHTYSDSWTSDATYHWHAATCEHVNEKSDKEKHNWDEGVVTVQPTANSNGEMKYTCKTCAATKKEVLGKVSDIEVDYENLTIYVPSGRNLRIAQFADLHFSKPGSSTYSNDKEERTIAFMQQVVSEGNPDLIVLSGDNLFGKSANNKMTGVQNLERLIGIMESLGVPYAFIYGNHDSEELTAGCSKRELNEYLLNCDAKYLLYGNECPETTGTDYRDLRYGTYAIKVCDKDSRKLTGALFMFDSGYYDTRVESYSSISAGQIAWYEAKVNSLQAEYQGSGVIPSIIFNHIQLPEYATAYITKYVSENPNIVNNSEFKEFNVGSYVEAGRSSEYVIYQELTPYQMYQVAHGGPSTPNAGMFDKMVSLGSTKAYFCGHAHRFTLQVKMDGIIMGFAPQTGFAPAEDINWDPRMGYVYNFNSNFDLLNTDVIQEDESAILGSGLAVKYMDATNGDSVFTVPTLDANGNYVYTVTMKKKWSRIKLYVGGEVVNLSGSDKYTISGDYSATYVTDGKLYNENGGPVLFFSQDGPTQYKITVNPTNKTVNIERVKEEQTQDGFVVVSRYNNTTSDKAVSTTVELSGGIYTYTVTFAKKWGYLQLNYNGIALTQSNTTYTGDIGAYGTDALYFDTAEAANQLNCWQANVTYVITYNPTTNTVTVDYQG